MVSELFCRARWWKRHDQHAYTGWWFWILMSWFQLIILDIGSFYLKIRLLPNYPNLLLFQFPRCHGYKTLELQAMTNVKNINVLAGQMKTFQAADHLFGSPFWTRKNDDLPSTKQGNIAAYVCMYVCMYEWGEKACMIEQLKLNSSLMSQLLISWIVGYVVACVADKQNPGYICLRIRTQKLVPAPPRVTRDFYNNLWLALE